MVLPLPRTSISFGTGAECFLAQAGSASMASGLRAGSFPVEGDGSGDGRGGEGDARPNRQRDQPSRQPQPVPCPAHARLLGHRETSCLSSQSTLSSVYPGIRPTLQRASCLCNPPSRLVIPALRAALRRWHGLFAPDDSSALRRGRLAQLDAQTFSKASDSASLGSRSGTSACRRISQLAAATKHPPTATSAATSRADGRSPSGWSVGMTCQ